jgi:hypothetical protein
MPSDWFTAPVAHTSTATPSTGSAHPDLRDYDVAGWSGIRDGDEFFVRIYADDATLNALAAESGVTRHDDVPVERLNRTTNNDRDASEWQDASRISTSPEGL